MGVIHKFVQKLIYLYIKREEKDYIQKIACNSDNKKSIHIHYPALVGPGEYVFIGENTTVLANSRLQVYPNAGEQKGKIIIGNDCFFGYRLSILAAEEVRIGNNVLMASDICIVSHNHGINPEVNKTYAEQELIAQPVYIGDNVWVGDKVVILPGVDIGKGSVIGAGSIVTKSIPEFSIAVGNPAKVIKKYNFAMHRWEKCE